MPTYRFKDTTTGEEFEKFMSISNRDQYMKETPSIEAVMVLPHFVHEPGTNLKVDDGFREVMSKIKNTYKINNIKSY